MFYINQTQHQYQSEGGLVLANFKCGPHYCLHLQVGLQEGLLRPLLRLLRPLLLASQGSSPC